MPLPCPPHGEGDSWNLCEYRAMKEKILYSGGHTSFCPAQQLYVPMGPRAKRETFQFQSCSCESLITARTGERPWVYIHAAWFRNWAQNKGRERVPKWPNMTKRNMQKNGASPPFRERSDGTENRDEYHSDPTHPAQHPVTVHGCFPLHLLTQSAAGLRSKPALYRQGTPGNLW